MILGIAFLISVFAALRGGYVGGDYNTHLTRILDSSRLFDFSMPDPPIYVLVAHGLFRLIGRNNGFPITLSIIQATINILALWWFFLYSERRFKSPVVHLALVFFLTFLPVRIMHAVSVGTDWMTVPVFVRHPIADVVAVPVRWLVFEHLGRLEKFKVNGLHRKKVLPTHIRLPRRSPLRQPDIPGSGIFHSGALHITIEHQG